MSTTCLFAPTVPGAGLRARIEAAGAVGFDSVSLSPPEAAAVVRTGATTELSELLARHRVTLGCLDPVVGWAAPAVTAAHPAHAAYTAFSAEECLDLTAELQVPTLNAIDVTWQPLPPDAPDRLGRLVERAAVACVRIGVEFQVYSAIATLDDALDLCRRSGAGLVVDAWHLHRYGPGGVAALADRGAVPVHVVQLSDGPALAQGSAVVESTTARRMPGAGDFDLPGLLAATADDDPLIGVEVFGAPEAGTDAHQRARTAICALTQEIA